MNNRTRVAVGISAMVATVAALALPSTALGADGGGSPLESSVSDEAQVSAAIARDLGVSDDEATQLLEWQGEFVRVANEAERISPATYANAEWTPGNHERGAIRFAGEPSAEVRNLIRELPFPVKVSVDAAQSRAEASASISELNDRLIEAGLKDFEVDADPDAGTVDVQYSVADVRRFAVDIEQIIADVVPATVSVTLEEVESAGLQEQDVWGGDYLYDSAGPTCTAGFTALRGGGSDGIPDWGVLTAGHCPNNGQFLSGSGSTYPLSLLQEHQGTYGDAQFMASLDPARFAVIQTGPNIFSGIDGVAEAVVGQYISNFGRTRPSQSYGTKVALRNQGCRWGLKPPASSSDLAM